MILHKTIKFGIHTSRLYYARESFAQRPHRSSVSDCGVLGPSEESSDCGSICGGRWMVLNREGL